MKKLFLFWWVLLIPIMIFLISRSMAQVPFHIGIPYQNSNGTITYLKPTGGIIANLTWNPPVLRTANNAGLRGAPGTVWVVNKNGDGQVATLGPGLQITIDSNKNPVLSVTTPNVNLALGQFVPDSVTIGNNIHYDLAFSHKEEYIAVDQNTHICFPFNIKNDSEMLFVNGILKDSSEYVVDVIEPNPPAECITMNFTPNIGDKFVLFGIR